MWTAPLSGPGFGNSTKTDRQWHWRCSAGADDVYVGISARAKYLLSMTSSFLRMERVNNSKLACCGLPSVHIAMSIEDYYAHAAVGERCTLVRPDPRGAAAYP